MAQPDPPSVRRMCALTRTACPSGCGRRSPSLSICPSTSSTSSTPRRSYGARSRRCRSWAPTCTGERAGQLRGEMAPQRAHMRELWGLRPPQGAIATQAACTELCSFNTHMLGHTLSTCVHHTCPAHVFLYTHSMCTQPMCIIQQHTCANTWLTHSAHIYYMCVQHSHTTHVQHTHVQHTSVLSCVVNTYVLMHVSTTHMFNTKSAHECLLHMYLAHIEHMFLYTVQHTCV